MDIMQLCRLCLVKDQVNIPIFGEQGDIRQIFLKITACLPVKVSKEDNLPKKICDGCLYKLELLYQFWNTTVNAEKQLLEWLNQAGLDANKKATDGAMAVVNDVQDAADLVLKEEAIDITEVRGDEEDDLSTEANSYILQQQQLPYQTFEYQQDGTKPSDDSIAAAAEETTQPPAKRQKVSAAPAQTIVNPETESDDDIDTTEMKLTKVEDDSDGENPEPTTFVGVDNEQPGPSGVGKTAEAPFLNLPPGIVVKKIIVRRIRGHRCRLCERNFNTEKAMIKHCATDHQGAAPYGCSICSKTFKLKLNRDYHVKTHTASRDLTCDRSTTRKPYTRKDKDYQLKCMLCDEVFPRVPALKEHCKISHDGYSYKCEICDKLYKAKTNRDLHMKAHSTNFEKKCEKCGRTYTSQRSLYKHMKAVHQGQTHICDICGKQLEFKHSLDYHMRSHLDQKNFKCEVCGKAFTRNALLVNHRTVHTKEKPFICEICGRKFGLKYVMVIHKKNVHGSYKPYECPVCHRMFAARHLLNSHCKTHRAPLDDPSERTDKYN